jgi:hypothetical protein
MNRPRAAFPPMTGGAVTIKIDKILYKTKIVFYIYCLLLFLSGDQFLYCAGAFDLYNWVIGRREQHSREHTSITKFGLLGGHPAHPRPPQRNAASWKTRRFLFQPPPP